MGGGIAADGTAVAVIILICVALGAVVGYVVGYARGYTVADERARRFGSS